MWLNKSEEEWFQALNLVSPSGHSAVVPGMTLATHMEPDASKSTVLKEQLVEGTVQQDEVEVRLTRLFIGQTDVGSFTEKMLRVAHTVQQVVEQFAPIAAVDVDGAEAVAQGLEDLATQQAHILQGLGIGHVVDVILFGRCRSCELS